MKKICFVKMDMTDTTGAARVACNLANELSEYYEVHMVSICSPNKKTFYPLKQNIVHEVLFEGEGRIREVLYKGSKALREYIQLHHIDIAFSVGVSFNPFVAIATRFTSCRFVACEHINSINTYGNDTMQKMCRYVGAKCANKIVVLTNKDREAYLKKYHLSSDKVITIYNWMDDDLFNTPIIYNSQSKKMISVGRLEKVKGVENIIELSKRLKPKFPDWTWDVYGSGDKAYVSSLSQKINELELNDFLHLKGRTNQMYELYSNYGLFVLTSYCEGLPMVLLEAKAKKIPCLSFDCATGPSDIIVDGKDGYLMDVDDLDTFEKRLSCLMESEELRQALSNACHDNIHLFKKEEIFKQWITLVEEL